MPKDRSGKRRAFTHDAPIARPLKRQFAIQGDAVRHVEAGDMEDASGNEILRAIAVDEADDGAGRMKKKEKRQLKHELFLERLDANHAPYSKSHARRIKRKERDQLATGSLKDLAAALAHVKPDNAGDVIASRTAAASGENTADASLTATATATESAPSRPRPGQIGAGKSAPPSATKRKNALKVERFRLPQILANAEFAKNPFATIRTHAKNTLVQHTPPSPPP